MSPVSISRQKLFSGFALLVTLALVVTSCAPPSPTVVAPPTKAAVQAPAVAPPPPTAAGPDSTVAPQPPAAISTQPPAATSTQPTAKKVQITFWKQSHAPADELTKTLIKEYQEKYPNVTIQMDLLAADQVFPKILTAVAGGQAPDIYVTNDTNLPTFVSKGVLAPIDPVAFGFKSLEELEKAYVPNSLNPFKGTDGKIYGMPFEYNSWPMVINDKIFKEANLDPAKDYPKTWEEVGTIGAKLAKVSGGRFERQGFAWNLLTSGYTMLVYPTIVYQLGGSVLTNDDQGNECALSSPEGVKAMEIMQDIYYKYKAGSPGSNISTTAMPMDDFVQEKVAMWIIGPWSVPTFKPNPSVWENYRVVPLPQATGAKRHIVAMSSWAWVVNKNSPNTVEAWKFMNFAQQQGARWLPAAGYVLPRLGWTDSPEAKAFRGLDVFVEQMSYGRPRLQHPNAAEINAEVHKAVQNAVLNNVPAKQAIDGACVEINKILKKQ
jgi:multiple sugar transport system substrate-binding protein